VATAYVLSTLSTELAEFAVTIAELKRQITPHGAGLPHVEFLLLSLMLTSIPVRSKRARLSRKGGGRKATHLFDTLEQAEAWGKEIENVWRQDLLGGGALCTVWRAASDNNNQREPSDQDMPNSQPTTRYSGWSCWSMTYPSRA
jgi:hypothetical protein